MAGKELEAKRVLAALGEPGAWKGRPGKWREAMAAMPSGPLPFLDKATLEARCVASGIDPDRAALLAPVADEIAKDPALRAFAWYMHWRVYRAPRTGVAWGAPSLAKRLGGRGGLFYLLLSLDFAEHLAAWHRRLGYPPEVTAETMLEIACYEAAHMAGPGGPGMNPGMYAWLAQYLHEPFVRLGRFEYEMCEYWGGAVILRRDADGAVIALAEGGTRVGDDGLRMRDDWVAPKGATPAEAAAGGAGWKARFKASRDAFTGYPIDPSGRVLRHEVRLARPAWRQALKAGDTVLNLHIPYGGGMDWEKVCESVRRAAEFFPKYHPDRPFRMLVLTTWFMDPQLAGVLPPDANPLRFQRACYLVPCWPEPDGLWFVFQKSVVSTPPGQLPARTSVQRALIGFLERGGKWHGGSMFVLPEDMPALRENHYREKFAALGRELGIVEKAS